MDQRIEPINDDDFTRVEAQRDWVRGHFTPETQRLYEELDQKLRLLETILANRWVDPSETVKLQSIGITLGDAIV